MIPAIAPLRTSSYETRHPPAFLQVLGDFLVAFERSFSSDRFRFGHAWYLLRPYERMGKLDALIRERQNMVRLQRERWRSRLKDRKAQKRLEEGCSLTLISEGIGGAYLMTHEGSPEFVVKPVDEEIFCLNNQKGYGALLDSTRVRPEIPLYRTAQTDSLASDVCTLAQLPPITPKTWMEVLSSTSFYDLYEGLPSRALKDKLCSVQDYLLPGMPPLMTFLDWHEAHSVELLDPSDVEAICLFIWLIYDTDGHSRNLLVYPKGPALYGLLKIDNTLSFPEANVRLENCLLEHPLLASRTLSPQSKTVLHSLPVEAIVEQMRHYEMESSIQAFLERVAWLRHLATQEGLTLKEIEQALKLSTIKE